MNNRRNKNYANYIQTRTRTYARRLNKVGKMNKQHGILGLTTRTWRTLETGRATETKHFIK